MVRVIARFCRDRTTFVQTLSNSGIANPTQTINKMCARVKQGHSAPMTRGHVHSRSVGMASSPERPRGGLCT